MTGIPRRSATSQNQFIRPARRGSCSKGLLKMNLTPSIPGCSVQLSMTWRAFVASVSNRPMMRDRVGFWRNPSMARSFRSPSQDGGTRMTLSTSAASISRISSSVPRGMGRCAALARYLMSIWVDLQQVFNFCHGCQVAFFANSVVVDCCNIVVGNTASDSRSASDARQIGSSTPVFKHRRDWVRSEEDWYSISIEHQNSDI